MRAMILSVFFFAAHLFATADIRPTNYQIIDSYVSEYATLITEELQTQGKSKIQLKVNSHQLAKITDMHFIEKLSDKNIDIVDELELNKLEVNLGEIAVRYLLHDDKDSLKRIIIFNCSSLIRDDKSTKFLSKFEREYSDNIGRDEISTLQNASFAFTTANVPDPKLSFFDKLIKPAVYITTAAITVLLLFTVRSN